ncbi:hypothetical protein VC83_04700 [Pseudogymnoascus destructans]|uniref:Uncharacterized protein n=2 Tax=Pseudogymnoascus destructans TaxID=655981 RepID=L8FTF1_PSED2|nr:uncharacterized protein VC83_04700 [Pseudogymnoascus destructans]ELR03844.1 hypothetical protein GMDG_01373 [Pseudogymnoascus destructans 20631-21]OAF57539.1 hypothetical protein VC83_04700 [Pseudogymnoascus destructans]
MQPPTHHGPPSAVLMVAKVWDRHNSRFLNVLNAQKTKPCPPSVGDSVPPTEDDRDRTYDEQRRDGGNIRIDAGWDGTVRVIRRPVPWTPNQGLKLVPPYQPQTAVRVPSLSSYLGR